YLGLSSLFRLGYRRLCVGFYDQYLAGLNVIVLKVIQLHDLINSSIETFGDAVKSLLRRYFILCRRSIINHRGGYRLCSLLRRGLRYRRLFRLLLPGWFFVRFLLMFLVCSYLFMLWFGKRPVSRYFDYMTDGHLSVIIISHDLFRSYMKTAAYGVVIIFFLDLVNDHFFAVMVLNAN